MLEIGTGCGYQTAVLAQIAGEVYTVERIGALVAKARRNLQSLKLKNVRLKHGDGTADLGEDLAVRRDRRHRRRDARADGAAARTSSRAAGWCCRSRSTASDGDGVQRLTVIDATPDGLREQTFDAVRFVPLLPGLA